MFPWRVTQDRWYCTFIISYDVIYIDFITMPCFKGSCHVVVMMLFLYMYIDFITMPCFKGSCHVVVGFTSTSAIRAITKELSNLSLIRIHGELDLIQHYAINFVCVFLWVLMFLPPINLMVTK